VSEGWRDRQARCDEFHALLLYQSEDGSISYVDEPPVVIAIADELLQAWVPADDGIVTIPTLRGPLVYDVIGSDFLRMQWIAIRVDADQVGSEPG
jgi:hypothetical protein